MVTVRFVATTTHITGIPVQERVKIVEQPAAMCMIGRLINVPHVVKIVSIHIYQLQIGKMQKIIFVNAHTVAIGGMKNTFLRFSNIVQNAKVT